VLLLAGGTSAQNTDAGRIFKAGGGGAIILSTVAEMMIATEMCALGDRADWQKVVTAVDRRYRFCVDKDEAWSRLMDDFKGAAGNPVVDSAGKSWGSFAIEVLLATRGAEARAMGRDLFCGKMPWKMVLVPGAATEEAKAEYLTTNPGATLDHALKFFTFIRTLGTDTAWAEAPCDKDFWPEFK
jgi:hypothetical protein